MKEFYVNYTIISNLLIYCSLMSRDFMKKNIFFIFLFLCNNSYAFTVYGFVPWSVQVNQHDIISKDKNITYNVNSLIGMSNIKVIYEKDIFTEGVIDTDKIKKIAEDSKIDPYTPISLDIEIGNHSKPETILPIVNKVLDLYHFYKGKAPIGMYALLPQNTYGAKKLNEQQKINHILLNQQYETLATKVNFLSPVFYFYDGQDMDLWKKMVDFGMQEAKKYARKYHLKIYPYVTNCFKINQSQPTMILQLDRYQMSFMLNYLSSKGSDGVIIWAGSKTVDVDGKKPLVSLSIDGWAEGVSQFIEQKR